MFYSQLLLAKKGPLAKIWLAAHFDKKLTKHQIFNTDISTAVDSVINPSEPLALRVSGHLMLGIVKIYSRKVTYLMSDVSEAMWKIKLAFRPGNVDLVENPNAPTGNAIDDPRYFGNIFPETDFPELADIAFSQNMLANYKRQNTAKDTSTTTIPRRKSSASPSNATFGNDLLFTDDESRRLSHSSFGIPAIRGSEGVNRDRASVSTALQDTSLLDRDRSISLVNHDDQMDFIGDMLPPIDFDKDDDIPFVAQMTPEGNVAEMEPFFDAGNEPMFDMGAADMMQDQQFAGADELEPILNEQQDRDEQDERVDHGDQPEAGAEKAPSPIRKKVERPPKRRVKVDERVELSSRELKEMMANTAPITRPQFPPWLSPEDRLTADQRLRLPSIRGMCPELQELFAITMSTDPLPFALLAEPEPEVEEDEEEAEEDEEEEGKEEVGAEEAGARSSKKSRIAESGDELDTEPAGADASIDIPQVRDQALEAPGRPSMLSNASAFGVDNSGLSAPPFGDEGFPGGDAAAGDLFFPGNDAAGIDFEYEQPPNFDDMFPSAEIGGDERDCLSLLAPPAVQGPLGALAKSAAVDLDEQEAPPAKGRAAGVEPAGDRAWNRRTAAVLEVLKEELQRKQLEQEQEGADSRGVEPKLSFREVSSGVNRRKAAMCFLEILQLKTFGLLEMEQNKPFADIYLGATERTWA